MTDFIPNKYKLPPEQEIIRAKCFHPAGKFIEFTKSEIDQSIPAHFERQVANDRDRVAVRSKGGQLSYGDLNKIANRIARALLSQRGKEEEPIALLLGHDAGMIASIIGVMKAGKTCAPLDPTSPPARIRNILADSGSRLIVTNSNYVSEANRLADRTARVINIDELDASLADDNIELTVAPETIAFILYTSGSTGQPKGVPQSHRNALHSTMAYVNNLRIQADDRLTLLGSCSGGQGMKIVISALVTGAALYPWNIPEEGLANLADWLIAEGITLYISGASVYRSFATTLNGKERFPALRVVRVGNEPVRQTDVELYKKHFSPDCIFVNWFALTETGNVACYYIDKQSKITDEILPIGYPCDDTEVLVLDDNGQPLGFGQTGEIAIRSRYLSPGYWRQPELTRDKFRADGGEAPTFLSGDLGFMLPDGLLYHAGRNDFQVKIRGNRLEIGEVETALRAVDGIREAAVVAQSRGIDIRLIAYIVTADKPAPGFSSLRRALAEKLPEHMIPSAFVVLAAMPLAANGKLDRRALPEPEQRRSELRVDYVPPRTLVEETLARIWADAIGLARVGIHDNFFELGGHSLLAIQIVSRVIKEFELEMSVRSLFRSPTVAEMALVITGSWGQTLDEPKMTEILTGLGSLTDEEVQRLSGEEAAKIPRK
ncbi:MAG TPA: non-ribosomal peptide synthetase [Candidatus Binatia bacterium]